MKSHPYADAPRLPDTSPLDPRLLVGAGSSPVELEIGPGRGGFLVESLMRDSRLRMVGLEVRRKWASVVDQRLHGMGLADRGRVFAADARLAIPKLVDSSLSVVYIHFPDPWWKKRHQKRLVLGAALVDELSRVIVPGGELFVQTDVLDRASAYETLVAQCPAFEAWSGSPRIVENPRQVQSPRERRAMADGLPIVRLRWRRRSEG